MVVADAEAEEIEVEGKIVDNQLVLDLPEEWESEEALAYHFAHDAYAGMRDHIGTFGLTGATSKKYRVDAEGPVYNEQGQATEAFA